MKAAVISLGSKSSQMTVDAMKNHFTSVESMDLRDVEVSLGAERHPTVLHGGKPLGEYDCVYTKGSFRYAPILRSLSQALHGRAYIPIQPESFVVGHDKILTHLAFQQKNVPMPTTYLTSSAQAAKQILTKVNYPIVLKFPKGTQGIGVMVADSYSSASSLLDALFALKQPFLIQEYIDTDGKDLRAFVIGNKVVAAIKRQSQRGEVRANTHAGSQGEPYNLDTYGRRVAVDAAKAIGADVCAIDMLEGPKGPLVIEANLSPGLQGITEITGMDIADKMARFFYEKASSFSREDKDQTTSKILRELSTDDSGTQQVVTNLNFRADRILLPKLVTDVTGFTEGDEFVVKVQEGRVIIERF